MARYVLHYPAQSSVFGRSCLGHNLVPEATLKGLQFLQGILRSIRPTFTGNRAVAVKACMAGLAVVCVAVLAASAQSGIHGVTQNTRAQNTVMSPYQGERDGEMVGG